jgi:hypothetical protein
MKSLLIQPPVADFYQTTIRTLPVGLLYLAASLRQNGFEEIYDQPGANYFVRRVRSMTCLNRTEFALFCRG